MKMKKLMPAALLCLVMASCSTPRNITYMQNVDQMPADVLAAATRPTEAALVPGDLVQINVSASDPEVVKPFNKTTYIATGEGASTQANADLYYYLIDANGEIEFPLLGRMKIGGLTQSRAEDLIASRIYPKYLTERPVVELRLHNFHVYTMGEVANPGEVEATNGRITILEAISKSGDLNIQGRRDNVMVIHTNADGSRSVTRVDLTDKNLLTSPSFYLQQNDVVYVEPNESKQRSSFSVPPTWTFATSIVGTCISIATLVITLTK